MRLISSSDSTESTCVLTEVTNESYSEGRQTTEQGRDEVGVGNWISHCREVVHDELDRLDIL